MITPVCLDEGYDGGSLSCWIPISQLTLSLIFSVADDMLGWIILFVGHSFALRFELICLSFWYSRTLPST
jgi:hypothetical protein